MIEDKFGLKDKEYWSDPWRTRKAVQRPLMQKGQEGLVLGAPGTVELNLHRDFPVALIRVGKLTTIDKVPSHATVILTLMDLSTYELRAGLSLPDVGRQPIAAEPVGAPAGRDSFSDDDSAMIAEGLTIDLATQLNLSRTRGEYLLTAILLDQASNRCPMKLVESAGYDDPAVDEFLREYRASRPKPAKVFPEIGEPLPSYRRQDNSPEIPAEPDIALSVSRVNIFDPRARCVLMGSYRLRIQPQHVVKPVKVVEEPEVVREETALVPITLLLTGSVDATPQIVKLVVPSYAPLESAGGNTVAVGHFSLDLCRLSKLLLTPQTYFIYAFSGEVMTAAVPTAFVRLPEEELDHAATW